MGIHVKRRRNSLSIVLLLFFCCFIGVREINGEIRFREITEIMNKECKGPSWGGAWGDFNGDGYADLWLTAHSFGKPLLFLNENGTRFREVSEQVLRGNWKGDRHGAIWTDFDNDGDQDLVQMTGGGRGLTKGNYPSLIYINHDGILEEKSAELGLSNPMSRCRDPFWLDINTDGLLDLIQTAAPRPDGSAGTSTWIQVRPGAFKNITNNLNLPKSISYLQLLGIEPQTRNPLRLLCIGHPKLCILNPYLKPAAWLSVTGYDGNRDKTVLNGIMDSAAADFSGNEETEIFIVRAQRGIAVHQDGKNLLKAKLKTPRKEGDTIGIEIKTMGSIQVMLQFFPFSLQSIFIGGNGYHPSSQNFLLSPEDPNMHGIPKKLSPKGLAVYIGWDEAEKKWQLLLPKFKSVRTGIGVYCLIKTSKTIQSWKVLGFRNDLPAPDALLLHYKEQTHENVAFTFDSVPLSNAFAYSSVIAGDFDNDMDIDLYVVANHIVANAPNILLENTGNGAFTPVAGAGGAEGSQQGVGESVISADFDNDGFLDFVLTNGSGLPIVCGEGAVQLYRNIGNSNHWIQFDLQGTVSNRCGVGAQLWLTTPDKRTQYRLAASGKHNRAQDFSRIHFGLGKNSSVNRVVIHWPSGIKQIVTGLQANRIYPIVEKAPQS